MSRVTDRRSVFTDALHQSNLTGALVEDAEMIICMNAAEGCKFVLAGTFTDDGEFHASNDLLPEEYALQALLSYQQNNARQRYRHHDPGE